MNSTLIELKNVHLSLGEEAARKEVLRGIDLRIDRGEFIAIVGNSGAGKSSLIQVLAQLRPPTTGEVIFDGRPLTPGISNTSEFFGSKIGFIYQQPNLLENLTVLENVLLPSIYVTKAFETKEMLARAESLLASVGLSGHSRKMPYELSGGQAQRVALCRALLLKPDVIVADEPTGALDEESTRRVLETLSDLQAREGTTLVIVTHSEAVAAKARRKVTIADGRIVEDTDCTNTTIGSHTQVWQNSQKTDSAPDEKYALRASMTQQLLARTRHDLIVSLRNLRSRTRRTILTASGSFLSCVALVLLMGLASFTQSAVNEFFSNSGGTAGLVVLDQLKLQRQGRELWQGLNNLTDLKEFRETFSQSSAIYPEKQLDGCSMRANGSSISVTISGFDRNEQLNIKGLKIQHGTIPHTKESVGLIPVVLGSDIALRLAKVLGRSINGTSEIVGGVFSFEKCELQGMAKIVGIFQPSESLIDEMANRNIYVPFNRLEGAAGFVWSSSFTVLPKAEREIGAELEAVRRYLELKTAGIYPFRTYSPDHLKRQIGFFTLVFMGFSILASAIGMWLASTSVSSSFRITVVERAREFAIRRSFGASRKAISNQVLVEVLLLGALAGALGIVTGTVICNGLCALAAFLLPEVAKFEFRFLFMQAALAFALCMTSGFIAGFLPAREASKLDIVTALRTD